MKNSLNAMDKDGDCPTLVAYYKLKPALKKNYINGCMHAWLYRVG